MRLFKSLKYRLSAPLRCWRRLRAQLQLGEYYTWGQPAFQPQPGDLVEILDCGRDTYYGHRGMYMGCTREGDEILVLPGVGPVTGVFLYRPLRSEEQRRLLRQLATRVRIHQFQRDGETWLALQTLLVARLEQQAPLQPLRSDYAVSA